MQTRHRRVRIDRPRAHGVWIVRIRMRQEWCSALRIKGWLRAYMLPRAIPVEEEAERPVAREDAISADSGRIVALRRALREYRRYSLCALAGRVRTAGRSTPPRLPVIEKGLNKRTKKWRDKRNKLFPVKRYPIRLSCLRSVERLRTAEAL